MDQTKSIKTILFLNILILIVAIVVLGMQIYQVTRGPGKNMPAGLQQSGTVPAGGGQQSGTMPQGGTQQSAGGQAGKCGDGVCDTIEKANPTLCSTDCK